MVETKSATPIRRNTERAVSVPEEIAEGLGLKLKSDGTATAVELRKAMASTIARGDGASVGVYKAARAHLVSIGFEFTLAEIKAAQ